VAKILAGSGDASIQHFRDLTTYGLLGIFDPLTVEFIDFLIGEGYVDPGNGSRPIIRVTPKGRQFLKERPPIVMPAT
jgi:hypothetical protein